MMIATLYAFTATPLYTADIKMLVQLGREKFAELEESNKSVNYSILFQERRQNINNELQLLKEENLTISIYPRLKKWLQDHDQLSMDEIGVVSSLVSAVKALLGLHALTFDQKMILKIKSALRVEFMPESDIIRLSFTWDDPEFAAVAVQAYAEAFMQARAEMFQAKKSYDFYKEQIRLYQKKLDEITASLRAFTKKWNLSKIDLEKELLLRGKEELAFRKQDNENKLKKLKAYLGELERMYKSGSAWIETPMIAEDETTDPNTYLQDIDRQYFSLKLERDQMLARFTPRSRELKSINRNIQQLRTRKYESLKNIIEARVAALEQVVRTVDRDIEAKQKRLVVLNQAEFVFKNLKLREKVARENLLMYINKAESLRIFDDRDKRMISSIKIMNKPLPPMLPSYPKKMIIIITTGFMGLFMSFGFAAISEYFSHVFRDEHDIENILEIPLLMSIVVIKRRNKSHASN
jgi:uncharacterized protein involved in exopolysaccharide biosynthesis